ncbi:MAG: hypothetical protein JJV93_01645 [Alphaproteobacteria bacterium]|nr:hypothetical protein [Alphaproteobacteria bacterium]MBL0717950.1 hypothetical protein [Alphaproteobacteria bacterium]
MKFLSHLTFLMCFIVVMSIYSIGHTVVIPRSGYSNKCSVTFENCANTVNRSKLLASGEISTTDKNCVKVISNCLQSNGPDVQTCQNTIQQCLDAVCQSPSSCINANVVKSMAQGCMQKDNYILLGCIRLNVVDAIVQQVVGQANEQLNHFKRQEELESAKQQQIAKQQQQQFQLQQQQVQAQSQQQQALLASQIESKKLEDERQQRELLKLEQQKNRQNAPDGKVAQRFSNIYSLIGQSQKDATEACNNYASCNNSQQNCTIPIGLNVFKNYIYSSITPLEKAGKEIQKVFREAELLGYEMTDAVLSINEKSDCLTYEKEYENGRYVVVLDSNGRPKCKLKKNNVSFFTNSFGDDYNDYDTGTSSLSQIKSWITPRNSTCSFGKESRSFCYDTGSVCLCDSFSDHSYNFRRGNSTEIKTGQLYSEERKITEIILPKIETICGALHDRISYFESSAETMEIAFNKEMIQKNSQNLMNEMGGAGGGNSSGCFFQANPLSCFTQRVANFFQLSSKKNLSANEIKEFSSLYDEILLYLNSNGVGEEKFRFMSKCVPPNATKDILKYDNQELTRLISQLQPAQFNNCIIATDQFLKSIESAGGIYNFTSGQKSGEKRF